LFYIFIITSVLSISACL